MIDLIFYKMIDLIQNILFFHFTQEFLPTMNVLHCIALNEYEDK